MGSQNTGQISVYMCNLLSSILSTHYAAAIAKHLQERVALQVGLAPGVGQGSASQSGRRLRQEAAPLFSRSIHSFSQPKWSATSRRRLDETTQNEGPQDDAQPGIFSRPVQSFSQPKWGS